MNRAIKEATVERYHYDTHDQLGQHLGDFIAASNFRRKLKTLKRLTPHEAICKAYLKKPYRFTSDPTHQSRDETSRMFDRIASIPASKRRGISARTRWCVLP